MNAFTYTSPPELRSALRLLSQGSGKAAVLAGGTDLLALLKDDIVAPAQLINIKGIPNLHTLKIDRRAGLRRRRHMFIGIRLSRSGSRLPNVRPQGAGLQSLSFLYPDQVDEDRRLWSVSRLSQCSCA